MTVCRFQLDSYFISGVAIVKCSQTGIQHKTKLSELSTESGEALTLEHLTKGGNLMLKYKGKEYAVKFVHFKGIYIGRNVCFHRCYNFTLFPQMKVTKKTLKSEKKKRNSHKKVNEASVSGKTRCRVCQENKILLGH